MAEEGTGDSGGVLTSRRAPSREVHCADALVWLREERSFEGCSFITSLPDLSELPHLSFEAWTEWFSGAARLVLERFPPQGVAIFYQSDVKKDGRWVDK